VELGHDTEHALATIVDLVNTRAADVAAGDGGTERPHADGLADLAALHALVERREISDVDELTADDLAAVRRLRDRLHAVFLAPDEVTAVELVNALVADGRTTPRLTDHDDLPLHIHYYAPGARLAEHLAADCGMALAFVLASGERARLAVCAAPDCERVLVDLSRNRSKRYCDSRTCGNRLHVAAYRARQRTS
jgi:predicted RNA-binding Zn ribbon-like protein